MLQDEPCHLDARFVGADDQDALAQAAARPGAPDRLVGRRAPDQQGEQEEGDRARQLQRLRAGGNDEQREQRDSDRRDDPGKILAGARPEARAVHPGALQGEDREDRERDRRRRALYDREGRKDDDIHRQD